MELQTVARPKPQGALMNAEVQRAVAEIQSALVIAKQFNRNFNDAKQMVIDACKRKKLAEQAIYKYARGGTDIEGPSIRLAEMLAQAWTNTDFGYRELSRGVDENNVGYSEVQAFAWDMENNIARRVTFRVRHLRDAGGSSYPLKTERDIYEVISNQASRRMRACILAVIPGDLIDLALEECNKTLAQNDGKPTEEKIQKIIDSFGRFGVTKEMIEARIQRKITAIAPQQIVDLSKIYRSISDGVSNAGDWFDMGAAHEEDSGNDLQDRVNRAKSSERKKEPEPEPEPESEPPFTGIIPDLPEAVDPETGEVLTGLDHAKASLFSATDLVALSKRFSTIMRHIKPDQLDDRMKVRAWNQEMKNKLSGE